MTPAVDMSDVPRYPSLLDRESPTAPSLPRPTTGLDHVACGLCGRVRAIGTPFCDHGAGASPPAWWKDSATIETRTRPKTEPVHNRRTRRRMAQVNVPLRRTTPSRGRHAAMETRPAASLPPVETMSREDMRAELREAKIKVRGNREELRARLAAHRRTEEDQTQ